MNYSNNNETSENKSKEFLSQNIYQIGENDFAQINNKYVEMSKNQIANKENKKVTKSPFIPIILSLVILLLSRTFIFNVFLLNMKDLMAFRFLFYLLVIAYI